MTGSPAAPEIAYMTGPEALPRRNGEVTFEAPWQGRALAMAIGLTARPGVGWDRFRSLLVAAIEEHPHQPYWENWVEALEGLMRELGLATPSPSHP